jgi:hypothetical protein
MNDAAQYLDRRLLKEAVANHPARRIEDRVEQEYIETENEDDNDN